MQASESIADKRKRKNQMGRRKEGKEKVSPMSPSEVK